MIRWFLCFVFALAGLDIVAHPVFFRGAWGVFAHTEGDKQSLSVNYSITQRWAPQLRFQSMASGMSGAMDYNLGLQINHRLWRKNQLGSQANIYLQLGAGCFSHVFNDRGLWTFFEGNADWETLTRFASISYAVSNDHQVEHAVKARLGFAPYKGTSNELTSWFMVETKWKSIAPEVDVTPLMRFFYKNVLWELGSSFRGNLFLTLMTHF